MQNNFAVSTGARQANKQPSSKLRITMLGSVIALIFGISNPEQSNADDSSEAARMKIAEIAALVRHSDTCPPVPPEWAAAYLIFRIMSPPTEELVEAQEQKMLALRKRIGHKRWCKLYFAEMEEAYIIYQQATRR